MSFKRYFKNLFYMSRSEQNGAIVLLIILMLVIVFRFLVPSLFNTDSGYIEEIEEKIAQLEIEKDSIQKVSKVESPIYAERATPEMPKPIYFDFDPNTISKDSLLLLGFSPKTASILLKYRKAGAKFYKPTDLMKVYGVDSTLFQELEQYVKIQRKAAPPKEKTTYPKKTFTSAPSPTKLKIEINSADSAQWTSLRGIGPAYAKRICNFRKYLGGFYCIEQIGEVYNLPEETYHKIKEQLTVDSTLLTKININFAEIDDLKRHPYCKYQQARRIVDYRSKNGAFSSVSQLARDSVLTSAEFERLSPYLAIN